jgi:hypothetical protein
MANTGAESCSGSALLGYRRNTSAASEESGHAIAGKGGRYSLNCRSAS